MKVLVSDELWAVIEPLLPKQRLGCKGRRPRVPDRATLTGILFGLQTGIPWEYLPREMGCGSGVTCWRRPRAWQRRGVWKRLHEVLRERLAAADRIDWSRALVDSLEPPGKKGGRHTGKNPTDKGKPGSTRHLVSDAQGVPLASRLTAANVHDSMAFEPMLDAIPPLKTGPGRPPPPPAREGARGQGLRLPEVPRRMPPAAGQAPHRAPRDRVEREARAPPLGGCPPGA